MHEWALAEAVVETVKKEIGERRIAVVDSIVLTCGELQNLDVDILREGLAYFSSEDVPISSDAVKIKHEPARFLCGVCQRNWLLRESGNLTEVELESIHFLPEAAYTYIKCPDCGSSDFTLVCGRGISVEEIHFLERTEDGGADD